MQDPQMLKHEITATLEFLPPDSLKLLAEFAAFLRVKREYNGAQSAANVEANQAQRQTPSKTHPKRVRVVSPRLVHREQAADFQMEVIVEPDHASL